MASPRVRFCFVGFVWCVVALLVWCGWMVGVWIAVDVWGVWIAVDVWGAWIAVDVWWVVDVRIAVDG